MPFIKNLSLEVVVGAVLYQYFLYDLCLHASPSFLEASILALVVWFVYLVDRQIDNLFQPIQDVRHRVHSVYRRLIWIMITVIGFLISCLLPFLKIEVLLAGLLIAFLLLAYGFAWHKGVLRSEKELFTAILYGLGVGLVVWVREPTAVFFLLPLIGLAYQNLCFFNLLEGESNFYRDRLKKTEWILIGLLSGIYAATKDLFIVLPFLVTFGLTFLLSRSTISERNRFWGELAFWSPLIYLFHGIFST